MRATFAFLLFLFPSDSLFSQFRDSVYVRVQQDTIQVWDLHASANCGSRFEFSARMSNDTLYVVQTDTSTRKATCFCMFDLSAFVTGIPAGSYVAAVYRQELRQYQYPTDTVFFIGSAPFLISGTSGLAFALKASQSGCNPVFASFVDQRTPTKFALLQNFPNPFNPATQIAYHVPIASHVTIEVFDGSGRCVARVTNAQRAPGSYSDFFEAPSSLSSGVYYCRMTAGTFVQTVPMLLMK